MEDDQLSTENTSPLEQSDKQDSNSAVPQEQVVSSDSKGVDNSEDQHKTNKVETSSNRFISMSENKIQVEANSSTASSTQSIRVRQYQLAFDVDDTGSEASLTSSPRSLDMNNPITSYLSQHRYLPSPVACQSHDLESLSRDMISESRDPKEETDESVNDCGDSERKPSTTSTGDDASSVYSSSTIRPGSVSELSAATKTPAPHSTAEKERGESVKTPESDIKLDDITLTTESPNGPRHETPPTQPKVHALNILTSDSEAGESPPYSPVPYLSGEWKQIEIMNVFTCGEIISMYDINC